MGDYQGSEHLEGLSDAEKQAKDKAAGTAAAERLLGMAREGMVRLPNGKEFPIPEVQKQELRAELIRFVDEGIKKFDADSQAGLDEAEWNKLHAEIFLVAERFLSEARKAEAEKRVREIESLTLDDLEAHKEEISAFLRENPTYLSRSGEWFKINKSLGSLLGIAAAETLDKDQAKSLGRKIQKLVREKATGFSDTDGMLGPASMNALALAVGAPERMRFVMSREEHAGKYDVTEIMERAEAGETAEELEEHEAVVQHGGESRHAPDAAFGREAAPGFARLMKPSEQYQALSQFSRKQKMEMMAAVAEQGGEQYTPSQQLRIQQVGILKQVIETIQSDVKESRTWREWTHQAFNENEEETQSWQRALGAMSQEVDSIGKIVSKNPSATVTEFMPHFKELMGDYDIPATIFKDPASLEELQGQYISLIQFMRSRKDYESVRELVEGTLLGEQFEKARKGLDANLQQKMKDKAYEKINKMVTAETLVQWRDGGMTDEQIEEYKKALIADTADKLMNEEIQEMNDGRPFTLSGKEAQIADIYRDMTGAGDWNISDEKWDFIVEELIINAPLIIVSGGLASAARAGLSTGARAMIASGRLARLGLAVASGGEKVIATGRLGRNLYRAGKAGGLLFEGAVFESVHSLLKGDMSLFQDLPTFAKRSLLSAATLGAFKFSGKVGKKAAEGLIKITPLIKDRAVARAITHFVVHKNFEVATMLAMSAAQQGLYNGNFEEWDWGEEVFHAMVTAGALTVAGTVTKPVIEIAGKRFVPEKKRAAEPGKEAELVKQTKLDEVAKTETKAEPPVEQTAKPPEKGSKLREKFAGALKVKLESIKKGIGGIADQIAKLKLTLPNLQRWTEGLKKFSDALSVISPKRLASKALNVWNAMNEAIGGALDALGPKLAAAGGAGEGLGVTFRDMYKDFQGRRNEVAKEREARRAEETKGRETQREEAEKLGRAEKPRDKEQMKERKEWHEIKRENEVVAVGDLHGTVEAYRENLASLGVTDKAGNWTGGSRKLVFHGDILADRGTDGLRIFAEIRKLREQARVQGGDVSVLAGNHEDFALSFLMGKKLPKGADPVEMSASFDQGKGLLEFKKYGSEELRRMSEDSFATWGQLRRERKTILENMRKDPQGREHLEDMCDMKLAERVDDSLFVHTNPTPEMMEMIARDGIDAVNKTFQQGLRDALLFGKEPSTDFQRVSETFLNTDNRKNFQDESLAGRLQEQGINQIFYGHTDMKRFDRVDVGGIMLVAVDKSAFKGGVDSGERSVARIKTDGQVQLGSREKNLRLPEEKESAHEISPSDRISRAAERSGITPAQLIENTRRWDADPALRRSDANTILQENGLAPLTSKQLDTVMHVHEKTSIGLYQNDFATIRKMRKELKQAKIDADQSRVLMENGILGSFESQGKPSLQTLKPGDVIVGPAEQKYRVTEIDGNNIRTTPLDKNGIGQGLRDFKKSDIEGSSWLNRIEAPPKFNKKDLVFVQVADGRFVEGRIISHDASTGKYKVKLTDESGGLVAFMNFPERKLEPHKPSGRAEEMSALPKQLSELQPGDVIETQFGDLLTVKTLHSDRVVLMGEGGTRIEFENQQRFKVWGLETVTGIEKSPPQNIERRAPQVQSQERPFLAPGETVALNEAARFLADAGNYAMEHRRELKPSIIQNGGVEIHRELSGINFKFWFHPDPKVPGVAVSLEEIPGKSVPAWVHQLSGHLFKDATVATEWLSNEARRLAGGSEAERAPGESRGAIEKLRVEIAVARELMIEVDVHRGNGDKYEAAKNRYEKALDELYRSRNRVESNIFNESARTEYFAAKAEIDKAFEKGVPPEEVRQRFSIARDKYEKIRIQELSPEARAIYEDVVLGVKKAKDEYDKAFATDGEPNDFLDVEVGDAAVKHSEHLDALLRNG